MKKYEGKTFVFQGHTIKFISISKDGKSGNIKFSNGDFQSVSGSDILAITMHGVEVADSCDMEEGCSSCGS